VDIYDHLLMMDVTAHQQLFEAIRIAAAQHAEAFRRIHASGALRFRKGYCVDSRISEIIAHSNEWLTRMDAKVSFVDFAGLSRAFNIPVTKERTGGEFNMGTLVKGLLVASVCSATAVLIGGCATPSITAVDLDNSSAPEGIPYYLPKPYLIVAENIRYIPTPTVGLTQTASIPDTFQSSGAAAAAATGGSSGKNGGNTTPNADTTAGQAPSDSGGGSGNKGASSTGKGTSPTGTAKQQAPAASGAAAPVTGAATVAGTGTDASGAGGDKNASTNPPSQQVLGPASIAVVPSASIPDGLTPDVFYTYQIVYLPDLTHRYGLRVKGGSGEMRATLNLTNGWMFTGPGPLYLRDSFTGEKIAATGGAVSGIFDSASTFVSSLYGGGAAAAAKGVVANAAKLGQQGKSADQGAGIDLAQAIKGYAQLRVFEPTVTGPGIGATVTWKELPGFPLSFDRNVTGVSAPSGSGTEQPGAGAAPTSAQVISAVKPITVQNGPSGGNFTLSQVTVAAKTGQVSVVVGRDTAATAPPVYNDVDLKKQITGKVCAALATIGAPAPCLVSIDTSNVQSALAK
jgi:hypothetical protein